MVEINLPDPISLLVGKSVPSISFKDAKVGDAFTGVITALETSQVRNYEDSTILETWPDGSPKLQVVVTLATDYADSEEDDGERKLYLFGQKLAAAKAALKEANLDKLELGTNLTITYSGTKPSSNKKYNDVKLYKITLVKGTSNPAVDTLLASGAKPVEEDDKLDAETIGKIEKLSANGFSDEDIFDALKGKVNLYSIVKITSASPF
jgi:hypothetical protein